MDKMDELEEMEGANDGWCLFHMQKKHSIFILNFLIFYVVWYSLPWSLFINSNLMCNGIPAISIENVLCCKIMCF
jgi:hypothetical protein